MFRPVLKDVDEGGADLAWRPQDARVISVSPDRAVAAERAIDGPGQANREALQATHERRVSIGLDDEVEVIGLDAELEKAKALAGCSAERRADPSKNFGVSERGQLRLRAQRDVHGTVRAMGRSWVVRDDTAARRGLAPRAASATAP